MHLAITPTQPHTDNGTQINKHLTAHTLVAWLAQTRYLVQNFCKLAVDGFHFIFSSDLSYTVFCVNSVCPVFVLYFFWGGGGKGRQHRQTNVGRLTVSGRLRSLNFHSSLERPFNGLLVFLSLRFLVVCRSDVA